jgi:hypothetical protein
MTNRRKFLIGVGSLAAGSAAAVGSGAFTSVQAERSVSVDVADDSDAYLAFDDSNSTNGAYAGVEDDGSVYVDLGDNSVDGSGLNTDALTQINDIFRVKNQGTQGVLVYVDPDSIDSKYWTTTDGFGIDPQATDRPNGDYTNTSGLDAGVENDQISLTGVYTNPPWSTYGGQNDGKQEFYLESGQQFEFGLYVDTRDGDFEGDISMEIVADATAANSL